MDLEKFHNQYTYWNSEGSVLPDEKYRYCFHSTSFLHRNPRLSTTRSGVDVENGSLVGPVNGVERLGTQKINVLLPFR